jgi:hypothetical protein
MIKPVLSDIIRIRSNYLRAVRLQEDLPNSNFLEGFTLTTQALFVSERITEGLTNHTRAWTLTGPYGSGKSFFGLFLANLFDKSYPGHATAWKMIFNANPLIAENLRKKFEVHGGLLAIPVTGARSSPQECLARSFLQVLESNNFPEEIKHSLEKVSNADSRTFLNWVKNFVEFLNTYRPETKGLLILFDEMGKSLEYCASHIQRSDIFILQELAEFAAHSNSHPVVFIGILHQSFEGYATLLDRSTQREWAKIQGRFEDIAYQESPIQQMRLLADAFVENSYSLPSWDLALEEWCPQNMDIDEFKRLCQKVYPLHPSVYVILPYMFRRLAQNERSIFAYLSSQEPFGFQEFISTHTLGDSLNLPNLFDYISANYQAQIYTIGRVRPLTETLERLENTPFLKPIEKDLLKTIGLLNWLGEFSPFQPRESLIFSALTSIYSDTELKAVLRELQQRSLIVYRRFNDTYVIWQGSDVDIEERLRLARSALETTISVAEVLQSYLSPRSLHARRHSYQTGTQRFFNVRYIDMHNRETTSLEPSADASGVVLLCLPGTLKEIEEFEEWARSEQIASRVDLIIGIATRAIRLRELVQELRGLHWVRENTPELRDDPVARKEWRTRLAMLERAIRTELDEAFTLQQVAALKGCHWFYRGEEVSSKVRRGLSSLLSDVCDQLYPASPRIWNELLNRRELTSQGAAARRILIEGILTRADQPLLGIQKFPPERSMYEALLHRGELHDFQNGSWQILPPKEDNPLNLYPAWQAIAEFIFGGSPEPRPLTDLYARLFASPYGVTAGLIPVLLAGFYKIHENEVTLYKEGTLLVEPSIADWEVLLRRPELFSIAGCRVIGIRAAIIERIANGLRVQPYIMPVVRSLFVRLKALPEHAQRTRKLPDISINLRQAVEKARSPERFLFVEIPEALGLPPFGEEVFDQERFETFFERLNTALEALVDATPRLLLWARDIWLTSCGLASGEEGWEIFRSECQKMVMRVTHPHLIPLVRRVVEVTDPRSALESVLAFIANRPPRAWSDLDAERFEAQAAYFGNLWRNEADIPLPHHLHERSQKIAQEIEIHLHSLESDKQVLQAALRILLARLGE